MRLFPVLSALALCVAVAGPARADKRLDEALAKAEAQLVKGKEDEAVKILQKAASQAPRDPEVPLALAQMLARLGNLGARSAFALRAGTAREALTLAQQAVEAEAGADSLATLARAQARLGDPAARETAERAARAAPSSALAQVARGDALLMARQAHEAEAAFQRALQLDSRSAGAGSGLAVALAAQGKAPAALQAARAATQGDARSGEAQAALALAALAQDPLDKNSEAVAAVQQGSFLEPKNPLVKLTVGRVFESRGQLAEAAGAYAQAAGLD